jgi:hypothetical protein
MTTAPAPDWGFLSTFSVPKASPDWPWNSKQIEAAHDLERVPTWSACDTWLELLRKAERQQDLLRQQALGWWRSHLAILGGDLSDFDFTDFRPLRTSVEEDWSDWLQFLMKTSTTGELSRRIFGASIGDGKFSWEAPEEVFREKPAGPDRAADLVVHWRAGSLLARRRAATHVEVKIWDRNFDKTYDTAAKLMTDRPDLEWTHFILIPDSSQDAWRECAGRLEPNTGIRIHILTWRDVAVALRRALLCAEPLIWRAWAFAFAAAVEQRLLGCRGPQNASMAVKIMTEAKPDE